MAKMCSIKTGLVAETTIEQIALLENYMQVWYMKVYIGLAHRQPIAH